MANTRSAQLGKVFKTVGMLVWVLAIVAIAFILLSWYAISQKDGFDTYDWSDSWSDLDRAARKGADCTPIVKVHRKFGDLSAWIWTVPKSCEQGLPHTRAIDVIAIPVDFPEGKLPEVLEHEKIHLLQRQMPETWERFYRIAWNYELFTAPPAGMPLELTDFIRANPDTSHKPWTRWLSRWWSVPVYPSSKNLSLSGSPVLWWDEQDRVIRNTPPEDWIRFFGSGVHQLEHPHEITAEYLSGPLRNGRMPASAPDAMIRLRSAWSESSQFPSLEGE